MAAMTAERFRTGNVPGSDRSKAATRLFGGAVKRSSAEAEEKSFEAVESWACTSRPITGSKAEVVEVETSSLGLFEAAGLKLESGRALLGGRPPQLVQTGTRLPEDCHRWGHHLLPLLQSIVYFDNIFLSAAAALEAALPPPCSSQRAPIQRPGLMIQGPLS